MRRDTAIDLPDEVIDRLAAVASRTGRTAESLMLEAIEERLEELEDAFLVEPALARRRRGESRTYSLDEVSQELGLDD
jgi:RHH-type rel operon transcriptional repressor/antitoxin RelB